MSKGIKIAIATTVFVILMAWAAAPALLSTAPAGSSENPLISQSYLEKVLAALRGEVSAEVHQLQNQVAQLQSRLNELENQPNEPEEPAKPEPPTEPEPPQPEEPTEPEPPANPEPPKPAIKQPLTVMVDAFAVNFRQEPEMSSTRIALLYRDEQITVTRLEDDWYQGKLSDGRRGWISAPLTKPAAGHILGVINANQVNVRTGPGTSYSRLADRLHTGTTVRILKQEGEWYQLVLADQTVAWIHSGLVDTP